MKTVAMVVSEEAYGGDMEMRDLVSLARKDSRVRVILVPDSDLQDLVRVLSEEDSTD